jgi:hypothetical protein
MSSSIPLLCLYCSITTRIAFAPSTPPLLMFVQSHHTTIKQCLLKKKPIFNCFQRVGFGFYRFNGDAKQVAVSSRARRSLTMLVWAADICRRRRKRHEDDTESRESAPA